MSGPEVIHQGDTTYYSRLVFYGFNGEASGHDEISGKSFTTGGRFYYEMPLSSSEFDSAVRDVKANIAAKQREEANK